MHNKGTATQLQKVFHKIPNKRVAVILVNTDAVFDGDIDIYRIAIALKQSATRQGSEA